MTPQRELSIREILEEREEKSLSPYASLSRKSKGRLRSEPPCPLRTCFQRDRDRIIHSKSFRRLKHKTQVFLAPEGDHYRTRITHTLEVSQIARTISRSLSLNEDLTEAIALGHDLGHTPFGHTGEEALSKVLGKPFKHNEQSLRVVDILENEGKGLNLSWEVRDGILNHRKVDVPSTLEGKVVNISDRIAYINHDIDDALRANIIQKSNLPSESLKLLGDTSRDRINKMVIGLVENSLESDQLQMSPEVKEAMDQLRNFLYDKVYISSTAKEENEKAIELIISLFEFYLKHPEIIKEKIASAKSDDLPIQICDYIAGMTDQFALREYEKYFLPKIWMG